MRRHGAVLAVLLLSVVLVGAPAAAEDSCVTIDTTGAGQGAPPQQGDPPGLVRTVAEIFSGPLQGTTAAAFTITGPTPDGFSFAGELTFTTDGDDDDPSTLTVSLTGTLNTTTGAFESSGPVIGGTEDFDDATGTLTLNGVQDLTDPSGSFTETVTGEICLDDDLDDDDQDEDDEDGQDEDDDEDD